MPKGDVGTRISPGIRIATPRQVGARNDKLNTLILSRQGREDIGQIRGQGFARAGLTGDAMGCEAILPHEGRIETA